MSAGNGNEEGKLGQFLHGLWLPWHLARALLGDPAARRLYLRVGLTQALVVLGVGLAMAAPREAWLRGDWDSWLRVLGALQGVQWVVVALSRDYHEAIGREASLLTGLEPEEGPLEPRVRLNVPWLVAKLGRYMRAAWLTALGTPVLWLATRVLPEPLEDRAFSALSVAWGAWWLMVFTAGKSARAWREASAPAPWFLRGWRWLGEQVPVLRRGLGFYGSLWEVSARPVGSPAASAERQPWAFAGLTVVHALSELPLLKCFMRPLIPVAAAHLLEAGGAPGRYVPTER